MKDKESAARQQRSAARGRGDLVATGYAPAELRALLRGPAEASSTGARLVIPLGALAVAALTCVTLLLRLDLDPLGHLGGHGPRTLALLALGLGPVATTVAGVASRDYRWVGICAAGLSLVLLVGLNLLRLHSGLYRIGEPLLLLVASGAVGLAATALARGLARRRSPGVC